ncbi:MAG: L,D-transpeptidase family protein [Campylobacterota bacterium]|nr:L,D-transpeptidase family protein [Campylobacterota bacterium]
MAYRVVVLIVVMWVLSSCRGVLIDENGWSGSSKEEFMEILQKDKYLSICDQGKLYNQIKSSGDTKLMSKMLVAYTHNLANGCIDLKSFYASQEAKKKREIDTYYKVASQKVDANVIIAQLKDGVAIEEILKPYIPTYPEFFALLDRYRLLKVSGKSSAKTLRKIRLNIERLKLMTHNLGENYVIINVPEFNVRFIEDKKTALKFGVVIGKYKKQTPIFSSKMQYIVVNPTWNVPDSIARKSIIPKVIKNPAYLNARNMVARKDYNLNGKKVDLAGIDWKPYLEDKEKYIPYKFIQRPSKRNSLGRVKFIFPNKYAVYMHDTNAKSLFKRRSRKTRSQSSGCIRLEKPLAMLHHVAAKYTNEAPEVVKAKYKSMKTHNIFLKAHIPVHTVYLTAFVDDCGNLIMSDDLYGFDRSQKLTF